MTDQEFHRKLTRLRKDSRWPDQDDFSFQVGSSYGGYRKYESGTRIPSPEVLTKICRVLGLSVEKTEEMFRLRDEAKARQVGISTPFDSETTVDPGGLSKRVQKEVSYVLKQAGIKVPATTQRVIEKRILLILKNALGS